MEEKISFSFGKNWQRFLKTLDEERVKEAEKSLTKFLAVKNLKNKTFLDIGCGSGLFSYAAFRLGANKIVSFDVDPFSVKCCEYLYEKAGSPDNWKIYSDSILDREFISQLGTFDVVYAWGILHHTGDMWEAIKNSASLVNEGGYFYFAIYNKVEGLFGSNFWLKVKKVYNFSPLLAKHILEIIFTLSYISISPLKLRNPIKEIKNFKKRRGMNWLIDVRDWLGGYPYEFATVEEIFQFMQANFPNFVLKNIKTTNRRGNNWFLFKRL